MTLQEKYIWATLYAAEFAVGIILVSLYGLLGDFSETLTAVIALAGCFSLLGIVHAFRLVYLKGKNSAQ